jgi:hypothetical protein
MSVDLTLGFRLADILSVATQAECLIEALKSSPVYGAPLSLQCYRRRAQDHPRYTLGSVSDVWNVTRDEVRAFLNTTIEGHEEDAIVLIEVTTKRKDYDCDAATKPESWRCEFIVCGSQRSSYSGNEYGDFAVFLNAENDKLYSSPKCKGYNLSRLRDELDFLVDALNLEGIRRLGMGRSVSDTALYYFRDFSLLIRDLSQITGSDYSNRIEQIEDAFANAVSADPEVDVHPLQHGLLLIHRNLRNGTMKRVFKELAKNLER